MDPNANLREQNELLQAGTPADLRRRAELRRALYDWIANGGFEPEWDAYPEAARQYRVWVKLKRRGVMAARGNR